jgi:hypothetical protein
MPNPGQACAYAIVGNGGNSLYKLRASTEIAAVDHAGIIETKNLAVLAKPDPKIALWIENGGVGE